MLYLYDEAIASDLKRSFNTENIQSPCVKVVDAERGIDLAAQLENDEISFPLVCLTRNPDVSIDNDRYNFTRAHRGVVSAVDTHSNNLYYEKVIPVSLTYDLTILATNTVDRDELVKELLFKYTNMYFVSFTLPYECKRKVRFGITIDINQEISSKSGTLEYIDSGALYQSIIPLRCEGCVLVSYTPVHLQRQITEVEAITKGQEP